MKKLMTICLVVPVIATSVHANAVATSTALIDWTSLTITGDITWIDESKVSYSGAYAENIVGLDEDVLELQGWVNTSAFASMGNSYGKAYTNSNYLYEDVLAGAGKTTTMWMTTQAEALRYGTFTANSAGTVEFSVDYELQQNLLTTNMGEWSYGIAAAAAAYLQNATTSVEDIHQSILENFVADGNSITDWDGGTLTVATWFDAGDVGYFEAAVWNNAEVQIPEPATICLLAIGSLVFTGNRNSRMERRVKK
jgi:hypothetical protein